MPPFVPRTKTKSSLKNNIKLLLVTIVASSGHQSTTLSCCFHTIKWSSGKSDPTLVPTFCAGFGEAIRALAGQISGLILHRHALCGNGTARLEARESSHQPLALMASTANPASRPDPDRASHRLVGLAGIPFASVDDLTIVPAYIGGVRDGLPCFRAVSAHEPSSRFP